MFSTLIKSEVIEFIDGPSGKLEMAIARLEENEGRGWGIVCHPHPLYGGTMDNKIVTTLVRTFQHFKLNTIRFNFRGVGRSDGMFDEGNGELNDLLAMIDWVQQDKKHHPLWLGGFSFGAYIATKAATLVEPQKLITIAPPVVNFPMDTLPPVLCDWVLVQGMQDDVVAPDAVIAWAEKRNPAPKIIQFPNAGHFFHGELGALRTQLEEVLS